MGCKGKIRSVDVGRAGHHYIKVKVPGSIGPRGGTTRIIGKLRKYK